MTYINVELRRLVQSRAEGCCEYCRISEKDRLISFEIDHVISTKHGGDTAADNLCLSCSSCNEFKGSNIASADPLTGKATFLFNPRQQEWEEHFQLENVVIHPLTPEGRVTVFLLRFNSPSRLMERAALIEVQRYPCR